MPCDCGCYPATEWNDHPSRNQQTDGAIVVEICENSIRIIAACNPPSIYMFSSKILSVSLRHNQHSYDFKQDTSVHPYQKSWSQPDSLTPRIASGLLVDHGRVELNLPGGNFFSLPGKWAEYTEDRMPWWTGHCNPIPPILSIPRNHGLEWAKPHMRPKLMGCAE
jgi:hypothetical protein